MIDLAMPANPANPRRDRLSWVVLSALAVLLPGCNAETGWFRSPGGSVEPITVRVRDGATHEPVADAWVAAEIPNRNHPFSIASALGQTTESRSSARTDAAGTVRLAMLDDRELRIVVWPRGGAPTVFFPIPFGPEPDWLTGAEGSSRPLQIRVER